MSNASAYFAVPNEDGNYQMYAQGDKSKNLQKTNPTTIA